MRQATTLEFRKYSIGFLFVLFGYSKTNQPYGPTIGDQPPRSCTPERIV